MHKCFADVMSVDLSINTENFTFHTLLVHGLNKATLTTLLIGSGDFAIDGNLPLESILP